MSEPPEAAELRPSRDPAVEFLRVIWLAERSALSLSAWLAERGIDLDLTFINPNVEGEKLRELGTASSPVSLDRVMDEAAAAGLPEPTLRVIVPAEPGRKPRRPSRARRRHTKTPDRSGRGS